MCIAALYINTAVSFKSNISKIYYCWPPIFSFLLFQKTICILPWVPAAFHARFPVSVKSAEDMSAYGRRSSSSNSRNNLWYPGYLYFGYPQNTSVWHGCHARNVNSFRCWGKFYKSVIKFDSFKEVRERWHVHRNKTFVPLAEEDWDCFKKLNDMQADIGFPI